MGKAVAVIDIGMTNKKVAVYDEDLKLLAIVKRVFEPLMVEGLETHDLAGMETWFLDSLAGLSNKYDIGALVLCTHGATFVCADAEGVPVLPCVYYTHEPGHEFQERFYTLAGSPVELQAATGTPNFSALINPAKGLLFAKERWPEAFAAAKLVLPYPQYWGMRLTGKAGLEGTYMGCHTYLYDWKKNSSSVVAERLGVDGKLPFPLRASWEVLGTLRPEIAKRTGLSPDTVVTMGIHDSNASLLPYLIKEKRGGFVVNSTGTWCVLMRPCEKFAFAPEELGKVVFFNRSAYNEPVKTAIFLGGKEYEVWSKLIGPSAGTQTDDLPDASVYASVLAARSEFILPEIVPGSGQFPGSVSQAVEGGRRYLFSELEKGCPRPAFLAEKARAEAVLNISLALQTIVALERTGLATGEKIFTEGGFRNNPEYNALLAAALPENPVYLTDMAEATSFGAALTGLAALERRTPTELGGLFEIHTKGALPMAGIPGFEAYKAEWLRLIESGLAVGGRK
ncbi:MAG: FGGY family carbohydrate kinase [Spirochaetes bacterium]|nr:FGGY family carbohydrate kinase [Spirochaetota bacterium]